MSQHFLSRRTLLKALGYSVFAATTPSVYFARAAGVNRKKLIMIILRGGMDGLAALAPYADVDYRSARGGLALNPEQDGLLDVDGFFALHPSFKTIHKLYKQNQALFLHACATPYRSRSHFDGQDVLENGMEQASDSRDGWLNRALSILSNSTAIALSPNIPLVLQGNQPVQSWSASHMPEVNDAFYDRIAYMYARDEQFHNALMQGIAANKIALSDEGRDSNPKSNSFNAESAAKFLREPNGPNIAVLEIKGWDTHANQGKQKGSLAARFSALDANISALKQHLKEEWKHTAILVATEFGRTVSANGTNGSDHGTASVAMLLGGAVQGGRMLGNWPGLAKNKLFEGRDLYPANDLRNLFSGVLQGLYDVDNHALTKTIFPKPADIAPLHDLIRSS